MRRRKLPIQHERKNVFWRFVLEICFVVMEPEVSALHLFTCLADEYVLIIELFCSRKKPMRGRATIATKARRREGRRMEIARSTSVDAGARREQSWS